jgi:hypothetical protein
VAETIPEMIMDQFPFMTHGKNDFNDALSGKVVQQVFEEGCSIDQGHGFRHITDYLL